MKEILYLQLFPTREQEKAANNNIAACPLSIRRQAKIHYENDVDSAAVVTTSLLSLVIEDSLKIPIGKNNAMPEMNVKIIGVLTDVAKLGDFDKRRWRSFRLGNYDKAAIRILVLMK